MSEITIHASTAAATVTVDAPIASVWALVADPTRMPEFSPEVADVDVPGALEPGATFTGHNERGGNAWDVACEVLELVAPTTFAFRAGDDEVGTTWRFELAERDGRVELTESFDSLRLRHPDWADRLDGRHAQLVADVHVTLDAIRDAAEAQP